MMIGIIAIAVVIFAGGVAFGVIAIVSVGIKTEERRFRQRQRARRNRPYEAGDDALDFPPEEAPGPLAWGARRVTGLTVRNTPDPVPSRSRTLENDWAR